MCWASCSLRYWDRRTCSSESLRGDSASAASTHTVRVAMGGGVQGRESDPGIVTVKRGSDGKDSLGWTWTMTSNLHVTTVSNYKYFSCREDSLGIEPLRMKRESIKSNKEFFTNSKTLFFSDRRNSPSRATMVTVRYLNHIIVTQF